MFRPEVAQVINKGQAWAFIGSGPSIAAGGPTWTQLLERALLASGPATSQRVESARVYRASLEAHDYPRCFSVLEQYWSRTELENSVRTELGRLQTPGPLLDKLADWPFRGYITTNYDSLMSTALRSVHTEPWLKVGNTLDEARLVSGEADHLIWHLHGSIDMRPEQAQLVLTAEDYESIYPDSAAIQQLRALLMQRRIVFIGFGFTDARVRTILERVGSLTDPARPLYAFLPTPGRRNENLRSALRKESNVETIPFNPGPPVDRELQRALSLYSAFILKRTLRFNQPERHVPSYHPETTGLLVYNELRLRNGVGSPEIVDLLVRSRIVSHLKDHGPMRIADLKSDLDHLASDLGPTGGAGGNRDVIETIAYNLIADGTASFVGNAPDGLVELTPAGDAAVADQASAASRLARQFRESLSARAQGEGLAGEPQQRVARAAEFFLRDCLRRRALGIAMVAVTGGGLEQVYQLTALLQALPDFMEQLQTSDEALALVHVVEGVLTRPSSAEEQYVGLILQAVFAVHLLGYDPATLKERLEAFKNTVFVADATFLIDFLALGSPGHKFATGLAGRLRELGAEMVTTPALAMEVAEHAQWALDRVDPVSGAPNVTTFMAASGRTGDESNDFLNGFFETVYTGDVTPNYYTFLEKIIGRPVRHRRCTVGDVEHALQAAGIATGRFDGLPALLRDSASRLAQVSHELIGRRQALGTFTHERQSETEAEALIVVEGFRAGKLKVRGQAYDNAFFMSNTRAVDDFAQTARSVAMRVEAVMAWATTLAPCPVAELRVLTNHLLSDLARANLDIVDKRRIGSVFQPLISASKEQLTDVRMHHRDLLANHYGPDFVGELENLDPLEAPAVADSLSVRRIEDLESKVQEQQRQIAELNRRSQLTARQREQLAKYEEDAKRRRRRARRDRRS